MILKVLIKKPNVDGDNFIHFWNNNSDNFWDTCKSEIVEIEGHKVHKETEWNELDYNSPIDFYLGEFFPNYEWKEIDATKIQRTNIDSMQIQMSAEEIEEYKNFFFQVIDGNTIMYYYCESIADVSDQNNIRTSYVLNCELDLWATYWSMMHSFMKKFNVEISFANKMCDRFIFDNYVEGTFTRGFWNDFIEQQWLCRTNQYSSDLYCYDNPEVLDLEQWQWINSEEFETNVTFENYKKMLSDWEDIGCKVAAMYTEKPASGEYSIPKVPYKLDGKVTSFWQNAAVVDSNIKDERFNSNGKYRYLVAKVANNHLPENKDERIKLMFSNIRGVEATKYNGTDTPEKKNYTFNGETLMYVPFIKGSDEDSYLKILNNNQFGFTLGSGYAMGMPINDIPPNILATALRRQNYLNVKNGGDQSIGDILSLRRLISNGKECFCPMDYVSIGLVGVWKGLETLKTFEVNIGDVPISGQEVIQALRFIPEGDLKTGIYLLKLGEQVAPKKNAPIYMLNREGQEHWEIMGRVLYDNVNGRYMLFECVDTSYHKASAWRQKQNLIITDKQQVTDIPGPQTNFYYHLSNEGWEKWHLYETPDLSFQIPGIPVIFTDFSHINIALTRKRNYSNVYGWSYFINKLVKLYQDDELTRKNTIESEPLFYSPGLWKWTYYIDGIHKIEITNDMLDIKKLMESKDWDINLNMVMSTHTSYFLDFKNIRNKKYPITKVGMEFISEEYTSYPFTTEAYNNWLQTNQSYIETAKNAKDIDYKWKMKNATLGGLLGIGENTLSGAGSGAIGGAMIGAITGGGPGAIGGGIIGGLAGGLLGGTGIIGRRLWAKRAYQESMEQFNNQVQGMKNNLFSSPATMVNPSGFNAGSVIYSPTEKSLKKEYELFKLYTIPKIVKSDIWKDISWNGYQFASQCSYSEYNNRVNFNIVNCNLYGKSYMAINYLRENMMEVLPFFSQEDNIVTFFNRCSKIMRLFKCKYSEKDMNKIIEDNIELKREWVLPYNTTLKFIK